MFSYIANNENYIYELNEDVDMEFNQDFKKGFTYRILSQLKASSEDIKNASVNYLNNGSVYTIVECSAYDPNSYEQRKEFLHILDYTEMIALIKASFLKRSSVWGNRK